MTGQRRVLIVDDQANARTALANLLREEGFEVATATHALEALVKRYAFAPHVVIAELEMSGMDGLELVAKLCQPPDPPSVIVMAAFGATHRAVEAMRAGALDYLTKPIRFDELLVVLGKAIEHHDLEHEVDGFRALGCPRGWGLWSRPRCQP